ncbi:MAG: Chaperone protein DnaJ [Dehalococcoidia bacterium]|nr:Chaperone protein DnaJ [Bacillota bacterium]MBT9143453.1 Chaperone protein DnaJ [Bacillota bacterium]
MPETGIVERSGDRVTIKCAFCDGMGKDPFGLLSILSTCQVCGGRGKVAVTEPFARCAFCNGSGVHPSRRYTCIACNGKGVIPTPQIGEREVCPECGGTGQSRSHWNVPCLKCKGRGFIKAERG